MTCPEPCENCRTPVTFVSAAGPIRALMTTVVARDEYGPQAIGRNDRLARPVWLPGNGLFEVNLTSEWRFREEGHALMAEFRPHTPERCREARAARQEAR